VQQAAAQLPWGHNLVLLDRLKAPTERLAYARAAIEHGWSRNVLNIHIETRLLERTGKAVTNFDQRLPTPQSDLAIESLKDPYRFDFLDRQVKHAQDNPSIGLLLCKSKNKVVAEYALGDKSQPMGIAEYKLVESLPQELQTGLPTIEQIERELTDHANGGMKT